MDAPVRAGTFVYIGQFRSDAGEPVGGDGPPPYVDFVKDGTFGLCTRAGGPSRIPNWVCAEDLPGRDRVECGQRTRAYRSPTTMSSNVCA
jgi:hypothetical protein